MIYSNNMINIKTNIFICIGNRVAKVVIVSEVLTGKIEIKIKNEKDQNRLRCSCGDYMDYGWYIGISWHVARVKIVSTNLGTRTDKRTCIQGVRKMFVSDKQRMD